MKTKNAAQTSQKFHTETVAKCQRIRSGINRLNTERGSHIKNGRPISANLVGLTIFELRTHWIKLASKILLFFLVVNLTSCNKKEAVNKYYLEAEIYDNAPQNNISVFFAFGSENYDKDTSAGIGTGQTLIYPTSSNIYEFVTLEYQAPESVLIYAFLGSVNSDNFYRVRIYKNDLLVHDIASYQLDNKIKL